MITVTDMFCGAGGNTISAFLAGADVLLAINHWKRAIETHNSNYPNVQHVLTDLHMANPRRFRRTTMLIASPECTNHSISKGRKRVIQQEETLPGMEKSFNLKTEEEERSRCTMWTPLDWAECHGYEAVILENVVDVHLWKPFKAWKQAWESLGYDYGLVYLNSMHAHPTPQSRDRMYFVAWKRGNTKPDLKITPLAHCEQCQKDVHAVQVWKNGKEHGKYGPQYVYCCPICVTREVKPYYYGAASAIDWSQPAPRIGDRKKPLTIKTTKRIEDGFKKFFSAKQPQPFILDHTGEYRPRSIDRPLSTICAGGKHHSLITPPAQSWLVTYNKNGQVVPTHRAAPTVTTVARYGLLTHDTDTTPIALEECGFRMLTTQEIKAAMAFPSDYILTGNQHEQIYQLGNAVTPPVMKLLIERVMVSLSEKEACA